MNSKQNQRLWLIIITGTLIMVGVGLFTGCIAVGRHSSETVLAVSPGEELVASAVGTAWATRNWENLNDFSASSKLRIRDKNGNLTLSLPWAEGRNRAGTEIRKAVWNPPGNQLAVLWGFGGRLDVVDINQPKVTEMGEGVQSFCWLGEHLLAFASLDSNRVVSVVCHDTNIGRRETRFSERCVPGGALQGCLSPDGSALILDRRPVVSLVDLAHGNRSVTWQTPILATLDPYCWSANGERCLVHVMLRRDSSETLSNPAQTSLLFLDRPTSTQIDLRDFLLKLQPDKRLGFLRPEPWGNNGEWFVVTLVPRENYPKPGEFEEWICSPSSWAAVEIRRLLGKEFGGGTPSPTSRHLALWRSMQPDDGRNGLYVVDVWVNGTAPIRLSSPRLVLQVEGLSMRNWKWSADGNEILTFDKDAMIRYPVGTATISKD